MDMENFLSYFVIIGTSLGDFSLLSFHVVRNQLKLFSQSFSPTRALKTKLGIICVGTFFLFHSYKLLPAQKIIVNYKYLTNC